MPKPIRIAFLSVILMMCLNISSGAASPERIGLYNSVKGYGLQFCFGDASNKASLNTITVYADLLDIYFGSGDVPGIKAVYQNKHITFSKEIADFKYNFFLGAGVQAGYCGDSFFDKFKAPGFEAGASFCAGWLLEFEKRVDLEISFSLEAGLHLRNEETYGTPALSFYINGLSRCVFPDLTIYYRF